MTYYDLINQWFLRSSDEAEFIFTRFIFLYISFIAFLSQQDRANDRRKIQNLKDDEEARIFYLNKINNDPDLRTVMIDLKDELDLQPITDSTEGRSYWEKREGKLREIDDWRNLIEFWYRVRNNLFHGHKAPEFERDQRLVTFAYSTLYPLMKNFIDHSLVWSFEVTS